MKKLLRGIAAAALALGWAAGASANNIYFDFTGTITSYSPDVAGAASGLTVTGGFNFETDRLYRDPASGNTASFVDWQPANLTAPLAFVSFGSREVTLPAFPGSNYSAIFFYDFCPEFGDCSIVPDKFDLYAFSGEGPANVPPDFNGTYRSSSLLFLPGIFQSGYADIDAATVDPLAILTMPADGGLGVYSEMLWSCVDGFCTNTVVNSVDFSIDSVTRGVPEPALIGLMAAGLLGMGIFRRKEQQTRNCR